MLFNYVQVRHPTRKMHAFVCYIFRVWCKAPQHEYSVDLFKGFPVLYEIMLDLDRQDKAGIEKGAGAFFYRHVNEIYNHFKALSPTEISNYRQIFRANNDIEALCKGHASPVRYPKKQPPLLMASIKSFFSELYSSGFFNLSFVKEKIGSNIDEHYEAFARVNQMSSCPFCGLQPLDTEHDRTREAYDHYLPSSVYLFNSVNFKNLAPSCYKCNSQNKRDKDPLLDQQKNPRKAFYPYAKVAYPIQVTVTIQSVQEAEIVPRNLQINLNCQGYSSEVDTWNELFRIKERYAAKCCAAGGGKNWLNRVLNECANYGLSPRKMLQAELESCDKSPWVEASFLKAAFLREANAIGLIPS